MIDLAKKLKMSLLFNLSVFSLLIYGMLITASNPIIASPLCVEPGWYGDFGFTGYRAHYQEKDQDSSFLMKLTGPFYGYFYRLGYQFACTDFRIDIEGYHSWGKMRYASVRTGESYGHKDEASEIRLLGYYPWYYLNDVTIEGYSGIGGRYLEDNSYDSITTTGHQGYWRTSRYTYIPVGLRFIKSLNCERFLIAHLEYDFFTSGKQNSYIVGYGVNDQKSGRGLRAGLDFQMPTGYKDLDLILGGFIRYWSIKDSDKNLTTNGRWVYWEPRNKTYEIGVKIGVVFF